MAGTDQPALSVVKEYHDAWRAGRVQQAAGYLAEDLVVEVPINSYPNKASFVEAATLTRRMASNVALLAEVGGEDEAVLIYDMAMPFGTMRIAEHFTVSAGRIHRIRHVHDTHALRSAVAAPPA